MPVMPYSGKFKVSSAYGMRYDPFTGVNTWHGGVDLVGESKDILSVCDGTVLQSQIITDKSNLTWEWGNYIAVLSYDGMVIYYCHLAERLVRVGEHVYAGQKIGIEGSTGLSTGSHLHFETRVGGVQTNPCDYLGIKNYVGYTYVPETKPDEKYDNIPHDWAKDAIDWAVANEILRGNGSGDLRLNSTCTREEVAVMLYRMYEMISAENHKT